MYKPMLPLSHYKRQNTPIYDKNSNFNLSGKINKIVEENSQKCQGYKGVGENSQKCQILFDFTKFTKVSGSKIIS